MNRKFKQADDELGGHALLSVVVPIFNEIEVIDSFYERLTGALAVVDHLASEIIFVDDGSRDASYQKLLDLAKRDERISVIKLSRNFGHQIAITAGIDIASGDAVVVIDADLQDPPEVIEAFVRKWEDGYDVVYGLRQRREGETRFKRASASLYYRLLKMLVKTEIPVDVGDFRLMSRRATAQFRRLREKDRFVRGMVGWLGFKQTSVAYDRQARRAGVTKYPLRKMMKFALDGIVSFSTVPLKLSTWLGYCASLLAFLYLSSVLVQKALGYTVQGWATIMVALLFLGGVQLICIGIIGEYVGRIFNEIKPRPLYIVEHVHGAAKAATAGLAALEERSA